MQPLAHKLEVIASSLSCSVDILLDWTCHSPLENIACSFVSLFVCLLVCLVDIFACVSA